MESEIEKPNLFNVEAEQIVLGTIIINNEYLGKVIEILKKEYFYEPAHQVIFEHIIHTTQRANLVADSITLKTFFDHDDLLKTIGGSKYLSILLSMGAGIVDIVDYAKMIQDLALKRKLVFIGEEIVTDAYKKSTKVSAREQLKIANEKLFELENENGIEIKTQHIVNFIIKEINDLEISMKDITYKTKRYIKTGFYDFDKKFKGFKRGELILLAGRPAMGKSTLAINIIKNIIIKDYNTLFFSLEMSSSEISTKLLANCSRINSEDIEQGNINNETFEKIITSYEQTLNNKFLLINDKPNIDCNCIKNSLKKFKRDEKTIDFIVIDYLQIMFRKNKQNANRELGSIMNNLKTIAKEFNIPILILSQLNRGVENRENKRPFLMDIRDSGEIEQIANMIIFCFREAYYLENDLKRFNKNSKDRKEITSYEIAKSKYNVCKNKIELLVRKNRRGRTGDCILNYEPEYSLVNNITNQQYDDHFRGGD